MDEAETAPVVVHGYHNAHMADIPHAAALAKEHQVAFLQVCIAVNRTPFLKLGTGKGRKGVTKVLEYIGGEPGTVEAGRP